MANSLGVEATTRRTVCSCSAFAMAGEGTDTQTGSGFSAGRSVRRPRPAGRGARRRRARGRGCSGAQPIPSGRLPVVLDPLVTRSLLALIGGALSGEAIVKGRSMFVGREGEDVAGAGHHARRRPHARRRVRRRHPRRRGRARPAASSSSPTGGFDAFLHNVYTARRAGARTTGSAVRGGFKSPPGVGRACAAPRARRRSTADEILASVGRGALRAVGQRAPLGHQPGERRLLGRRRRPRWCATASSPSRCARSRSRPRCSACCTTSSHVGADLTWLPGGAAGHDPARRRHVGQRRLTHRSGALTACRCRGATRGQRMPVAKMMITATPSTTR